MQVTRYKPLSNVTFITETGKLVARASNDPGGKMDDDVISITTTRDMGADAPTFTITLSRRKEWQKWVAPNDLVKIEMHRPPEANKTVLVGLVDDIRRRTSVQGEGVSRVITVTGRGVAKAFIQFDVGIVPEAEYASQTIGWVNTLGITLASSDASTIVQGVWDTIGSKFVNYKFSNDYSLFDLMKYNLEDRPNMKLLDESTVSNFQGSLWAFMKEIAEEPFYELFWETDEADGAPTLYMRPTPFNKPEWNKLYLHQITDKDVVMDDSGRSDIETYTLYSVGAKTLFSPHDTYKSFGVLPLWYEPYADKYGIRRLHVESIYMAVAEQPSSMGTGSYSGSDTTGEGEEKYWQWALDASAQTGWHPLFIYSQWQNESGNFTSNNFKNNNNLAGQTWTENSEYPKGTARPASEGGWYIKYPDPVVGYVDFINRNPRYGNVASYSTPEDQAREVAKQGWAVNPDYAEILIDMIQTNREKFGDVEVPPRNPNSIVPAGGSVGVAPASEDAISTMKTMMTDLYNWNIRNNNMYNGTLIVKGSNKYKIGQRLLYTSEEDNSVREYYITSVTHNFVNFGNWVTHLGVTRGSHPDDRFAPPVGEAAEYTGMGLVEFNPAAALQAMLAEQALTGGGGFGGSGVASGDAGAVVEAAKKMVADGGKINGVTVDYTFGGNDVGRGLLDCSSFTQYVYKTYANIDLGRTTGAQVLKGEKVEKANLQPGDLVFFKNTYNSPHIYGVSHVGIYIGGGEFIHNSSSKNINQASLSASTWVDHWLMGRRVVSGGGSGEEGSGGSGVNPAYQGKGKTFEATGYGAHPKNLMGGPGWIPTYKTATGTTPLEGRTIATDPKVIPKNSKVYIESDYPGITGEYIAEDVGGAIKGNKIDIYFNDIPPKYDPDEANKRIKAFGRRKVKVTIIERG